MRPRGKSRARLEGSMFKDLPHLALSEHNSSLTVTEARRPEVLKAVAALNMLVPSTTIFYHTRWTFRISLWASNRFGKPVNTASETQEMSCGILATDLDEVTSPQVSLLRSRARHLT